MSVSTIIADLEAKLSALYGQPTVLSDLPNNSSDILAQIALHYAGGLNSLDEAITALKSKLDIRTTPCECIDAVAANFGYVRDTTGSTTQYAISFTGIDGTVINSGTSFTDNIGVVWTLTSDLTISNNFAFGTVESPIGSYSIGSGELVINSPYSGVTFYQNGMLLREGHTSQTCEQFRDSILNPVSIGDNPDDLIDALNNISNGASIVTDLPDCLLDGCGSGIGIVVNGGDDQTIADLIRTLSPFNYARLLGNTSVSYGCEEVKFIRPYPVGIIINYWAASDIPDQDFIDLICETGTAGVETFMGKIPCLDGVVLNYIRASDEDSCTLPKQGIDCNGDTIDLFTSDDICDAECRETGFVGCQELLNVEYPVFVLAERLGDRCVNDSDTPDLSDTEEEVPDDGEEVANTP